MHISNRQTDGHRYRSNVNVANDVAGDLAMLWPDASVRVDVVGEGNDRFKHPTAYRATVWPFF